LITLSRNEVPLLLEARRPSPFSSDLNRELKEDGFWQAAFKIPMESGKLLSLIRHLLGFERKSAWTTVIVESAGIWPSWEDRNIIRLMREACGVQPEWEHGEAYYFELSDYENLISFCFLFSTFRYDFRIIDEKRELHVFFSHDDFFILQADERFPEEFAKVLNFTEALK
jgi:hypothetical protein